MLNRESIFLVLSAPSGGGKTTLCKRLIESLSGMAYSVSYTTRLPRRGEINGKDYHFISQESFQAMKRKGAFAEWALVHGNYYGTTLKSLRDAIKKKKDLVLDIDVQGAKKIKKKFKNAVLVFVTPVSLQELEKRLKKRKADSSEEIRKRLKTALKEIKEFHLYDYLVINEDFTSALSELKSIVTSERAKISRIKVKSRGNKFNFKKFTF